MNSQTTDAFDAMPEDEQAHLRQQAEQHLGDGWADDLSTYSPDDTRRLLHELRVHQIELEMQNAELHRSQEALLAAQARYFDLYDLAPVGYMTISQQGIILEANLTAARLLGVTRDALRRQPFSSFIHFDDQDSYYRCHHALDRTGQPQQCELRLRHQTGDHIWVRLDVVNAREQDDETLVKRITMSDITERKRAEIEHEHVLAQLAQAQKMETIGRLAGGIAHEFNNMLAVILMRAEMSLELVESATKLHRNLRSIYDTGQRSADLVYQLLGYARKQPIKPKVIDLNSTVEEALPMLRGLVGEEVELTWQPGASLWPIKMDPMQIQQILTNLCINARDAITGVGAITIATSDLPADEAATVAGLAATDYVVLTITDTGCGMDKSTLSQIFEPFFTTKEIGRGTGLGLAMVDGIARQNGGQIDVTSEPAHGTTFRLYLPQFIEAPAPVAAPQNTALASTNGETVLAVEDSIILLDMTVEFLQYLGYQVLAAATPREALRLAAAHPGVIDLLLTDIVMPEMNGRELAVCLTAVRPDIQALYVSGYPAEVVAGRGVLDAEMHFLQKPYSMNLLAATVRSILQSRSDVAGE